MKIPRVHLLTQISRFFSAKKTRRRLASMGKLVLWASLLALFAVNHTAKTTLKRETFIPVDMILSQPFSSDIHTLLADKLWNMGLRDTAKKELLIAQELWKPNITATNNVLGANSSPDKLLSQWEAVEKTMWSDLRFWQQLVQEKPDYRDGHIILAQLAYDLGEKEEAKTHLAIAQTLDPNNETVIHLEEKFK
jgi:tetratricopeptide (TPR) repeat protein